MSSIPTDNQFPDPQRSLFIRNALVLPGGPDERVITLATMTAGMAGPLPLGWSYNVLGEGATGLAALITAQGLGGSIGTITFMFAPPTKQMARALVIIAFIWGGTLVLFSFTSTLQIALIVIFINGLVFPWWGNILRTMFQLATRDDMRGRVTTMFGLIATALGFGWLIGGVMSEIIGPRPTLIISGVTTFL